MNTSKKHLSKKLKKQRISLAQLSNRYLTLSDKNTVFSNLHRSMVKFGEWISDSNLLVAIIFLIIVGYLLVCILCFYFAFYPDGIPNLPEESMESENKSEAMIEAAAPAEPA